MKLQFKHTLLLLGIMLFGTAHAGKNPGNEQMKKLFECGKNTEKGFNGWKISGLPEHANTYFEKDHLEIFQYTAGNYTVGLERRLEDLVGYTDLLVSLDMEEMENCVIKYTTAYVSADGKNWVPFQKDPRLGTQLRYEKMNSSFVRIIADMQFFQEARFRFNNIRIFGAYRPVKKLQKKCPSAACYLRNPLK